MDERGLFLLQQKDKLFMQLLKESDVVGMSKSQRWETQQLNKLTNEKDITPQFLLYYAQKTLRGEGQELERRILEADRIHTHKLLDLMTEANEGFQQNPSALAATLSALPNDSELKQHILKTHAKTLLQMTSPDILDVIEDASASSSSTRSTFGLTVYQLQTLFSDFLDTNEAINVEFLRRVGEKCGSKISAQQETRIALASQPDLYDFSEPLNFAKNSIRELKNRDKSYFQLAALISSQNVSEEVKEKVLFELLTSDAPNASPLKEDLIKPDRDGRLPISSDVIYGLLKKLHPKHPEGVKTLFESAGRMLLSGLTPTRIKELTPLIKSESSLKSFHVSDRALVAIIRDHSKGKSAADKKVVKWLLENSVDRLLPERVLGYVDLLTELGASREKIGKDVAWSVSLFRELVTRQTRNLLRTTPNLPVELFPETLWVLRNGTQTYDEAILEEVSKNINDWGWDKKLVEALIAQLPDLDDKWVKKWQKAVKIDDSGD